MRSVQISRSSKGLLLLVALVCAAPETSAQVKKWPGDGLNKTVPRSYRAGVMSSKDLEIAWRVFPDRHGVSVYKDSARTRRIDTLDYMDLFYVIEVDWTKGSLHIARAKVVAGGPKNYKATPVGWARVEDLLVSHTAFRHPKTFLAERALVISHRDKAADGEFPKLYAGPFYDEESKTEEIDELRYTQYFYVYKVESRREDAPEEYDPSYGYDWYLVSKLDRLNTVFRSDPKKLRQAVGWLRGENALIWNTRLAWEPAGSRSPDARGKVLEPHVFSSVPGAARYLKASELNAKVRKHAALIAAPESSWNGQRFRYADICQKEDESDVCEQSSGKGTIHPVAFQGHVDASGLVRGDNLNAMLEQELNSVREILSQHTVMFVLDATLSMCPHILSVLKSVGQIARNIESQSTKFKVGAVWYKDFADGDRSGIGSLGVVPPTSSVDELLASSELQNCKVVSGNTTYKESVLRGIIKAREVWATETPNTLATYILIGDAGSSEKEKEYAHVDVQGAAQALAGLAAEPNRLPDWKYSFHAIRIEHDPKASEPRATSERAAMRAFESDIRDGVIRHLDQLDRKAFERHEDEPSRHSYLAIGDVASPAERKVLAEKISSVIGRASVVRTQLLELLNERLESGVAPAPTTARSSSADRHLPEVGPWLEQILMRELDPEQLRAVASGRNQVFFRGYTVTKNSAGRDVLRRVLFFETADLIPLLRFSRQISDYAECSSIKESFREMIGSATIAEKGESIDVLLRKKRGIDLRTDVLDVRWDEIESRCHNDPDWFGRVLARFSRFESFAECHLNQHHAACENITDELREGRVYSLVGPDGTIAQTAYWVPVEILP